jgi:uncharacterized coiled-coil DUF342 family protein
MLSPIDWALIESWKERGVPLHVALRGIEHSFDSYEAKKHKRTVKTLLYCQEEVEAQYAEWRESRVGSHDEKAEAQTASDTSPFSRDAILDHLARTLDEIQRLSDERKEEDTFGDALARAVALLTEIRDDYATSANPDTRKLEESLTGIDRLLDDSIRAVVKETELASILSEIDSQMRPYKRHMDKPAFEQTRDNLMRKRLRDHFGVPRLSLFYL